MHEGALPTILEENHIVPWNFRARESRKQPSTHEWKEGPSREEMLQVAGLPGIPSPVSL
ncbi:hypothetical protein P7K49_019939, partial [Saguinus oedipus]